VQGQHHHPILLRATQGAIVDGDFARARARRALTGERGSGGKQACACRAQGRDLEDSKVPLVTFLFLWIVWVQLYAYVNEHQVAEHNLLPDTNENSR
jgi:hypothetical protein